MSFSEVKPTFDVSQRYNKKWKVERGMREKIVLTKKNFENPLSEYNLFIIFAGKIYKL